MTDKDASKRRANSFGIGSQSYKDR